MAALIAVVLLLGAGVAAWAALTDSSAPEATSPAPLPGQPQTGPADTATSQTMAPPAPSASVDPEDAALDQLTQQVSFDRPQVQRELAEGWVPQLSSKRPGLVVDGVAYRYTDILNDHRALRSSYNALLVWSGDWSSFREGNFYVTVAAMSFSTPTEANAWCDQQGIDPDNCYAKRLSTTAGPDGSTVSR